MHILNIIQDTKRIWNKEVTGWDMNVKTPIDWVSGTSIGKGHWRSFGSHSSPATSCIQEISLKTNHVCMKMQSPNQLNLLFFTHSDKIRLYHHLFKFFKSLLTKLRAYIPFGVWPSACPSKFTSHHCPILFCFNHLDSMIIRKLKGSRKKNEKMLACRVRTVLLPL